MGNSRRQFIRSIGAASLAIPLTGMIAGRDKEDAATLQILKPAALKPGDTIAITSPAGAVWDEAQIGTFTSILQNLGFKVKACQTLKEKYGYFAGTDEFRANELNDLFTDKSVNGIFCMKGGWGCARILDKLNYDAIKINPKVLMGFSDITSLLIAIQAKTGLVTFHGPVGNSGWNSFTVDHFKKILMNKGVASLYGNEADKPTTLFPGKAQGMLVGGNLTVLSGIIGSEYLPLWKDKILFLEEAKEEPYSIDRMLTQLKLSGVLSSISGFVFGKCVKCDAEEPEKAFTFLQVLEQHIKPFGIPAFYGAMIGHIESKFTVPLGIQAEMDADKGIITLMESAVI